MNITHGVVSKMAIADKFQLFCSNLVVKNISTISRRYKDITQRLNFDFRKLNSETSNSLYVGSYGRNTAIDGLSDLDMVYMLPAALYEKYNNYANNGQSALLQAVRESIKNRYPNTQISADGQIVLVPFNDGITFEVVPVFERDDDSFIFPDSNDGGKWKITNPRPEMSFLRNFSELTNGNLTLLCRMVRSWKHEHSVDISGLLIDTLACQFFQNYKPKDKSFRIYDQMSHAFFNFMASQDQSQSIWRAPGSDQYVYGGGFQSKAKSGLQICKQALEYQRNNYMIFATNSWRELYGNRFPQ